MTSSVASVNEECTNRVEGWLNVWEVDAEKEVTLFTDGRTPLPIWEPLFCVLCRQQASLTHYRSEKAAGARGVGEGSSRDQGLQGEPPAAATTTTTTAVRLDSGKSEFDKRWGYETLECIKENVLQQFQSELGSLEVFSRSHTLDRCKEQVASPGGGGGGTQTPDSCSTSPSNLLSDASISPDGAYEKGLGERRGSVPLVADSDIDGLDATSTQSRLASFFSKKVNKSNLKRTKSVTKLDRKKPGGGGELTAEGSGSNVAGSGPAAGSGLAGGPLKRTMSLGRLTRRGWRNRSRRGDAGAGAGATPPSTVGIGQDGQRDDAADLRMRSSQSHESLLSAVGLSSVDLSAPDVQIKPLHSSVLTSAHCFHVYSSAAGSRYYSCRTAAERQNWIEHLRKTIQPSQEQSRRTDHSIQISILEGKNVPGKKRYFCELYLDKTLYARTSSKTKGDMLFWGEHFDFNNLPSVRTITVNLYKEPDKKKKKDKNTLVGSVTLSAQDVSGRQAVERWYTVCNGKTARDTRSDTPQLRVRARYQAVQILPMAAYDSFIKYIQTDYCLLVDILEPLVTVKAKEEIATSLVRILHKLGGAHDFLLNIIMAEVDKLENENLAFRGNSIATKAMEAYMKLVGEEYLRNTLADLVQTVVDAGDSCEVDPARVSNNALLINHQHNLVTYCEMAWFKVINSHCFFPMELRQVFASVRERCEARHHAPPAVPPATPPAVETDSLAQRLLSACVFLRLLCPAILSPSLFGLTHAFPAARAGRNLTLITKTIQNLANFTTFGAKEEFMTFMNDFVEREMSSMKQFIQQISTLGDEDAAAKFDGYIDLGKELCVLHTLLVESLDNANQLSCKVKLQWLRSILSSITEALENRPAPPPGPALGPAADPTLTPLTAVTPADTRPAEAPTREMHVISETGGPDGTPASREGTKGTHVATISRYIDDRESFPSESVLWTPGAPQGRSTAAAADRGRHSAGRRGAPSSSSSSSSLRQLHARCRSETAINSGPRVVPSGVVWPAAVTPDRVDASWQRIVSAADLGTADHVLLSFLDDTGPSEGDGGESTVASSGYQSLAYSQSSSPVETSALPHDAAAGRQQPLSFANPLFGRGAVPPLGGSTGHSPNSSLGSDSGKLWREVGSARCTERLGMGEGARHPEEPVTNRGETGRTSLAVDVDGLSPGDRGHASRPGDLPALPPADGIDETKRTSTPCPKTVRMGVLSVQRKLHEKTKAEYEQELSRVGGELVGVQAVLAQTQQQLRRETAARHRTATECAAQLRRCQHRMAEQQRRKDQQMRDIIHRLIVVEEDLRREQTSLHSVVAQKQCQLEQQSRRIQALDAANARLVGTLTQLREHLPTDTPDEALLNGVTSPPNMRLCGENSQLKSSSC